jgi:hypothetical protein
MWGDQLDMENKGASALDAPKIGVVAVRAIGELDTSKKIFTTSVSPSPLFSSV